MMRVIYPTNCLNQTCGYWLIKPRQYTIYSETITKHSKQLQNNYINSAMFITWNCVIMMEMSLKIQNRSYRYSINKP